VPVEAVPLGNARDVQIDVQRRLLLQFSHCEERKDSRGCALLAVQIRLNAEWLRADAEEAPDAEPPVHVTFVLPPPRPARHATRPALEAPPRSAALELDAARSASPEVVVPPGEPIEPETATPGPLKLSLGSYAWPRVSEDEP
jgi:hypothetical protein